MTRRGTMRAIASRAPARVFVATTSFDDLPFDLALRDGIELVCSPRHATVLLVVGRIPASWLDALSRVHDEMPHPRATVWWTGDPDAHIIDAMPDATVVHDRGELLQVVLARHRDALSGTRSSEPGLLANVPPAPWLGVGPFGQGGEGMMGGTPYGRPMAMTADDRDGLSLDQLQVRVGPFFAANPPGLVLDVIVQGDVIQDAAIDERSWPDESEESFGTDVSALTGDLFATAISEPLDIAILEQERARRLLRRAGWFLSVHGLHALATRCWRLAYDDGPRRADAVARLRRWSGRAGSLAWSTRGVGVLPDDIAAALTGPATRAAGGTRDARAADAGYRALGFMPIVQAAGDAHARWRQWLLEAEQALRLAGTASGRGGRTEGRGPVEGPAGEIPAPAERRVAERIGSLLTGMEWGRAVTTIASLAGELATPRPVARVP